LVIDHVHGGINLFKYFYILATNPRTHCKIISLKKNSSILFFFKIENSFVDVDGAFLYLQNGGNSPPKEKLITSMFILIFSKKLDKFMMISKIELKNFQIYFMLTLFIFLRLDLLKLLNFIYLLGVTFFCSNFWQCFCCLHFSLNFFLKIHFFQQELPS
jgi:hypothetical protein